MQDIQEVQLKEAKEAAKKAHIERLNALDKTFDAEVKKRQIIQDKFKKDLENAKKNRQLKLDKLDKKEMKVTADVDAFNKELKEIWAEFTKTQSKLFADFTETKELDLNKFNAEAETSLKTMVSALENYKLVFGRDIHNAKVEAEKQRQAIYDKYAKN